MWGCIPAGGGGGGIPDGGAGGNGGSNGNDNADNNGNDNAGDTDLLAVDAGIDNLEGDPIQGNIPEPNVLIEYSDFQCPACLAFYSGAYQDLRRLYIEGGKLAFVYRHFPITAIHEFAQTAAEAAQCYRKGTSDFFSYHDMLFENQPNFSDADLQRYAEELGEPLGEFFNADDFRACRETRDTRSRVQRDVDSALELGVQGTPTLFLNGELFEGRDFEDFVAVLGEV